MFLTIFFSCLLTFAQNTRGPDSIPPDLDFSSSSKESFTTNGSKLIESRIRLEKLPDSFILYLPNFILPSGDSIGKRICQNYDTIKLELRPEGIAVDGEIPTIKLSAPCNLDSDTHFLTKIVIPMKQIQKVVLSHKLKDKSFEVSHYLDSWPQKWKLKKIDFSKSNKPIEVLGLQTNLDLR